MNELPPPRPEVRWQFGIVDLGMFANMEKGLMLFRRPVPAGVRLPGAEWCRVIQF